MRKLILSFSLLCSCAVAQQLITSQTNSSSRTFDGCVGMVFTMGGTPYTATSIGRWAIGTSLIAHDLSIYSMSTPSAGAVGTRIATVTLPAGSSYTPGAYAYQAITPVTLAAGATYTVTSLESTAGSNFYDDNTVVGSAVSTIVTSAYFNGTCGASFVLLATVSLGNHLHTEVYDPVATFSADMLAAVHASKRGEYDCGAAVRTFRAGP